MQYNYCYNSTQCAYCVPEDSIMIKDWKKDILTIPNLLSLFRLLLIPVYVVIYLNAKQPLDYVIAAAILAISCLTDMIDGKIARHYNMISTIGKVLDPIADKATQFTLLLCLSIRHRVLWSLALLFVIKEGFQLIAGFVTLQHGKMLSGALLSGKICTTVLFISLIVMVLMPDMPQNIIHIITLVDAVFMLIAFIHYALTYYKKAPIIQDLPDNE